MNMNFLLAKTPDGRNKLFTLLVVFLVPLPFILLFLSLFIESRSFEMLNAMLGLVLFIVLWAIQVIKGTYYQPIESPTKLRLYKFSGWALLFAFVILSNAFVKEGLKNLGLTAVIKNEALLSIVYISLSYMGWWAGKIVIRLQRFSKYNSIESLPTPHSLLEQTIVGFLAYAFISLLIYVAVSVSIDFLTPF